MLDNLNYIEKKTQEKRGKKAMRNNFCNYKKEQFRQIWPKKDGQT